MAELAAFTDSLRGALEHLDALPDRAGRCDPDCGFLNHGTSRSSRPVPVGLSPRRRHLPRRERWRRVPVACSLDGDAGAERAAAWAALLDGAARDPIPDGVQLTMPASRAGELAGLAAASSNAARSSTSAFDLDGDVLTLQVRAPAAAAATLTALFS